MSGGGSQQSLRKYLGAIKDTTTVSLAKVNSDYKVRIPQVIGSFLAFTFSFDHICYSPIFVSWTLQELDIAVVKATNHVERPPKEKYIRGRHFLKLLICGKCLVSFFPF